MKIEACPFCGGEAEIERYGTSRHSTIYACTECGCQLETGEEWGHGTRWNTRPPTPREKRLEEALRGLLHVVDQMDIHPSKGGGVLPVEKSEATFAALCSKRTNA